MIRIVTDTTANLPYHILEDYDIPLVAQYVHFGEETFREYYDLSTDEFFSKLAASSELPKTSAPSVGDFVQVYEDILKDDPAGTILSIHPSTDISGTVRSALVAADEIAETYPQAVIHVYDTRSVSIGLGFAVWESARRVQSGASAEEVLALLDHLRDHTTIYFVVDTLEYLAKGGRIGRASHLLGSLLDIKPILALLDGVVTSHSKARTRKKSLTALLEYARDGLCAEVGAPNLWLGVAHAVCEVEARAFADTLCNEIRPGEFLFAEAGPAIGVHTGPGVIAVGWVCMPE